MGLSLGTRLMSNIRTELVYKYFKTFTDGKTIPTELRNEEVELRKSMKFDDTERSGIICIIVQSLLVTRSVF